MSLFYEDNIFSTTTNLTYGPRLKKQTNIKIITQYLQYIHKNIKVIMSEEAMPYLYKICKTIPNDKKSVLIKDTSIALVYRFIWC